MKGRNACCGPTTPEMFSKQPLVHSSGEDISPEMFRDKGPLDLRFARAFQRLVLKSCVRDFRERRRGSGLFFGILVLRDFSWMAGKLMEVEADQSGCKARAGRLVILTAQGTRCCQLIIVYTLG